MIEADLPRQPAHLTGLDLIRRSSGQNLPMSILSGRGEDFSATPLMEGYYSRKLLRPGLSLHATSAREYGDFIARTELPPGLSCIFYLKGTLDIELGARSFHVGEANGPSGLLLNRAEPELFKRYSLSEQMVRKVVIGITPEWLGDDDALGLRAHPSIDSFFTTHLNARRVAIGPAMLEPLMQLSQPEPTDVLRSLREEAMVLQVLLGAFAEFVALPAELPALRQRETKLLQRALAFIAENIADDLTTLKIASAIGCSPSSIQRLFLRGTGTTLFAHIREQRLELARRELLHNRIDVAEAARLAGYRSVPSFSTAFLRKFGERPINLRKGNA